MASNYTCSICLKAVLRRTSSAYTPVRSAPISRQQPQLRTLTTSSRQYAAAKPELDTRAAQETTSQAETLNPYSTAQGAQESAFSTRGLAQQLRKRAGSATETYVAYGATQEMFKLCSSQADYTVPQVLEGKGGAPQNAAGEDVGEGTGWWYNELGLTPTFNTWAQVTFLHMWLLVVRLRVFPAENSRIWHQHLIDHFSHKAEERMETLHGIIARSVRNRYLKDLFIQWRGVLAAYDEGMIKGDAVMATAVWRNIFKAEKDVDGVDLAMIVAYVRANLALLGRATDEEVVSGWSFTKPDVQKPTVMMESRLMKEPFANPPQV